MKKNKAKVKHNLKKAALISFGVVFTATPVISMSFYLTGYGASEGYMEYFSRNEETIKEINQEQIRINQFDWIYSVSKYGDTVINHLDRVDEIGLVNYYDLSTDIQAAIGLLGREDIIPAEDPEHPGRSVNGFTYKIICFGGETSGTIQIAIKVTLDGFVEPTKEQERHLLEQHKQIIEDPLIIYVVPEKTEHEWKPSEIPPLPPKPEPIEMVVPPIPEVVVPDLLSYSLAELNTSMRNIGPLQSEQQEAMPYEITGTVDNPQVVDEALARRLGIDWENKPRGTEITIINIGEPDPATPDLYPITFRITDPKGNYVDKTFKVKLVNKDTADVNQEQELVNKLVLKRHMGTNTFVYPRFSTSHEIREYLKDDLATMGLTDFVPKDGFIYQVKVIGGGPSAPHRIGNDESFKITIDVSSLTSEGTIDPEEITVAAATEPTIEELRAEQRRVNALQLHFDPTVPLSHAGSGRATVLRESPDIKDVGTGPYTPTYLFPASGYTEINSLDHPNRLEEIWGVLGGPGNDIMTPEAIRMVGLQDFEPREGFVYEVYAYDENPNNPLHTDDSIRPSNTSGRIYIRVRNYYHDNSGQAAAECKTQKYADVFDWAPIPGSMGANVLGAWNVDPDGVPVTPINLIFP